MTPRASTDRDVRRRPVPVTVVVTLVVLSALVVIAAGLAIVAERANEIVQLPALLARVDGVLPFDSGQDLQTYVAATGIVIAVTGAILALLALGVARGRAVAFVAVLILLGVLSVAAILVRARTVDDLAQLGVTVVGGALGVLFVLTLALLAGRRSRTWVLGRT